MGAKSTLHTRLRPPPGPDAVENVTTTTYSKGGITLAGRYYGETPLPELEVVDLTEGVRASHPANIRKINRNA